MSVVVKSGKAQSEHLFPLYSRNPTFGGSRLRAEVGCLVCWTLRPLWRAPVAYAARNVHYGYPELHLV
jgi:hypothetical protein